MNASFEDFRKYRALFSWICHIPLDLLHLANKMAQLINRAVSKSTDREFNKAVEVGMKSAEQGLTFGKLDEKSIHLKCYADASFSTKK